MLFVFYINTFQWLQYLQQVISPYLLFIRKVTHASRSNCTKSTESQGQRGKTCFEPKRFQLTHMSSKMLCELKHVYWKSVTSFLPAGTDEPISIKRTIESEFGSEELVFILTNKQKWPLRTFTSMVMLAFWIMNENVFSGVEKTRC